MAADRIARSSDIDGVRLHVGRVLILLAAVVAVVAVLLVILAGAA